jgi:hypothetical protein
MERERCSRNCVDGWLWTDKRGKRTVWPCTCPRGLQHEAKKTQSAVQLPQKYDFLRKGSGGGSDD